MQTVTVAGSSNEVIVAGRDVHYEVVYQLPRASAEDRHHLLGLLQLVRRQWLVSVLDQAVKETALLELGMHAEPRMVVERPWTREQEAVGNHPEVLAPGTGVAQVFDDSGRTLLILGEAGAGKTITLLTLAREWVDRAERDPFAPVPVVLNLSSWAASRKSIHDWIVHELARHYEAGEALAVRWLKGRRLLLLLDGLDEVVPERRAACVEAIHDFVVAHGVPGLAVCCRRDEYRAIPVRLSVGGAVTLLPLTPAQVNTYVQAAGDRLSGVRSALGENAELRGLAESPLMLNILSVAFAGVPAGELRFDAAPTRDALRDTIFSRYVHRMFGLRDRAGGVFPRERTCGWLRWLANGMMQRGESIFAIELLQPAWLSPRPLLLYTLVSRVAGGIALAAVIGAVVCLGCYSLILAVDPPSRHALASTSAGTVARVVAAYFAAAAATGLAAGLLYASVDYLRFRRSPSAPPREVRVVPELLRFLGYMAVSVLAAGLVGAAGWAMGLSPNAPHLWAAVLTVLVSVLSFPLFFWRKPGRGGVEGDIGLAATLTWRWRSALEIAAVCVVADAIVVPFSSGYQVSRTAALAVAAMAVVMAVAYGSWRHEVPSPDRWSGGTETPALRKSARFFAYGAMAWVLVLFPVLWSTMGPWKSPTGPLALAALTAIVLAGPALFWFGGLDVVLHASLCGVLSFTGATPLRLRRFLDHAVHLGFLQRAGGGYIFIHRLLLEHFAARPDPGASTAPTATSRKR